MNSFRLTIVLGNAAMSSREDVALALRKVASRLENLEDGGRVRDENGNTVGEYEYECESEDDEE